MKVAITGGGNVYALNLAQHLSAIGVDHFGIGRTGPKPPAMWQVNHHYRYWALHIVDQLPEYMAILDKERPDVVVNYAAQGEGAASFGADAHYYYQTNCVALVKFVEELRKRDYIKRFIQIGSSEVYGTVDGPTYEHGQFNPTSPYGVSKAAFDKHLEVMHRHYGFPANVVRPSNAYCPGQQLHRIIPKAIICALTGTPFKLHGGGLSRKCYFHADDLSRGIMAVLEHGVLGEVYNCTRGDPISMKDLTYEIADACDVPFDEFVEVAPERPGQDMCYWPMATKLEQLGWRAVVTLEHGLGTMVDWVRRHPELLAADSTFRLRP